MLPTWMDPWAPLGAVCAASAEEEMQQDPHPQGRTSRSPPCMEKRLRRPENLESHRCTKRS